MTSSLRLTVRTVGNGTIRLQDHDQGFPEVSFGFVDSGELANHGKSSIANSQYVVKDGRSTRSGRALLPLRRGSSAASGRCQTLFPLHKVSDTYESTCMCANGA